MNYNKKTVYDADVKGLRKLFTSAKKRAATLKASLTIATSFSRM